MSTIAVTATDPETAGGVTVHRKTYCCTSELEGGRGRRRRGLRSKKEEGEEEEEEEGGRRRREKRGKKEEEEEERSRQYYNALPPSLSSSILTTAHKGISKATVYTATAVETPLQPQHIKSADISPPLIPCIHFLHPDAQFHCQKINFLSWLAQKPGQCTCTCVGV